MDTIKLGLALVSVIASTAVIATVAIGWEVDTVDNDGNVGINTSIALDNQGNPHIAYRGYVVGADPDPLKYAVWNGSGWDISFVESEEAGAVSLELDSQGYPCIAYSGSMTLKYAHWDGTDWEIQTVDTGASIGIYVSLELDSNGNPHIAYTNGPPGTQPWYLDYAYWSGTDWVTTTVDDVGDTGGNVSLALDSSDYAHISYCRYDAGNQLKYAHWNGNDWETGNVGSGQGIYTSIVIDSQDYPHISYCGLSSSLKYANWNGSNWDIEIADPDSLVYVGTSLLLDDNENPHISYGDYSGYDQKLKYAEYTGSQWEIDTVDNDGEVGKYSSLALDASGNPHISYYDQSNGDLKYAYLDTTGIDEGNTPVNPVCFILHSAYPNPSNGNATISFALPEAENVNLSVYDIKGRKIVTAASGEYAAGEYNAEVNGLASGVYIYELSTDEFRDTKKMVVK